ncbi:MAG: hypothetical protein JO031_15755 [Ktedonobacteraceae bacterium]|nr:hypothetical protein [Ktedonobacteraceae bacterium]
MGIVRVGGKAWVDGKARVGGKARAYSAALHRAPTGIVGARCEDSTHRVR